MVIAMLSAAFAGSGPWVSGSGVGNLYLGIEGEQYTKVSSRNTTGIDKQPVGEGIQSIGGLAVLSYGIAPRVEAEVTVPYLATHVNREDSTLCELLGEDSCDATHTVGIIQARVKTLILDGIAGSPLSLSVAGEVRYGGLTATTRHRLTNAGEGTTDFGPSLALGRSGTLGANGFYALSGDFGWRYRVPNTRRFPNLEGQRAVPGSEFFGSLEALVTPTGRVSVGPYAVALYRPQGIDFSELAVADQDRFAALRVTDIRAGGKLLIRDAKNHVFVLAVGRTVYSANSPADSLTLSFGVSLHNVFRVFERAAPAS